MPDMPRHAPTCPNMPDSPTARQPDSARQDTSVVTAYLGPDMPDSAGQLLDSCQECQPDRGLTGPDRTRQCLTVPTGLTAKAQQ
jgi:uncharacterized protein YcnI